ncbi:MAG TPA: hypothetical protein VGO62_21335, partial [Myxococcota bacterium]
IDLDGAGLAPLECDDHNACTDEHFDPDTGTCARTDHDGACDDGSACTQNDRCFLGACVGDAIVCADTQPCTRDTCDPNTGCAFIPDDTLCADDDPCSLDRCDPSAGCTHAPAPDGTPCGAFAACVSVDLCIAHICTPVAIPDNTPCSDDDVCTIDDHCVGGACAGTATHAPPAVIAQSHRLVAPATSAFIGDTLFMSDDTVKVIPVGGSGIPFPTSSIDLIAGRSQLFASGQHLVGVGNNDRTDQHLRIVDPFATPPTLLADVDMGHLLTTDRPATIASDGGTVYACRGDNNGGLVAVSLTSPFTLATLTTSACPPLSSFATRAMHGDLALDIAPASLTMHVHALVALSVVDEANVTLPEAFGAIWLGSDRAVLSLDNDGTLLGVDFSDLAHPHTALVDEAVVGCSFPVAMIERALYCEDSATIRRVDFSDVDDPVPDSEWQADNIGGAGFDNDATRLVNGQGFGTAVTLVSLFGAGAATPIGARGGIAHVAVDDDNRVLGASDDAVILFPPVDNDVTVLAAEGIRGSLVPMIGIASVGGAVPALLELPVQNDVTNGGTSYGGVHASIVGDGADVVAPLDTNAALSDVIVAADGTAVFAAASPTVLFPGVVVDQYFAAAADGCTGLALVAAETFNPPGVTGVLPLAVTLSSCNPALPSGGLVPLGTVGLDVIQDAGALSAAKIVIHHDTVATVFLDDRVSLVDFTDPTAPLVLASGAVPGSSSALFRDAGFDSAAQSWLVALTEPDGTATITQLAADTAAPIASWQVSAGAPGNIIRQRVLAVLFPRAYLSAWDPAGPPEAGHGVAIYDLTTSPPSLEETLPLASEPVDLVPENDTLAVARVDGISLISPPCGP